MFHQALQIFFVFCKKYNIICIKQSEYSFSIYIYTDVKIFKFYCEFIYN